mmetsp:Transcript_38391/g.94355  ORF Transcript_38391/g.94355 Transcript_38391/m.94355 type:complete len:609 (-) Transcript_38391:2086-3912(-)|eukprot:CAMPEP_0206274976 /NCGR_PEP_ID=MMETSP0047_2-20121206/35461_1 /ASSEMBLY_ACC=CAM_ASM_000192 /TAXON_ID=195065 /ORGANISM="Chroomonas mesostigmatica_cf, Strain CCMP1168" /LENGTH=608 /DNA_ID=CAMNT_0053704265 /DNA_START=1 /DNA_END=1827 /DNA_ORIENTATION=-
MAAALASKDETAHIDFESILDKLDEHIDNVGVDQEVLHAYKNILRAKTILPYQCAFMAAVHQLAIKEAYVRRRQLRREELSRTRKFTGQVKIWVLELKDIDLKHSLGDTFDGNLSLTVRVSVEGQVKGTTKSSSSRSIADGSYEPMKINQDVDFYVKRPTSIIHLEVLHINDEEPEGSLARETLLGQVHMSLQPLESQKTVRQWYPCQINGEHSSANLQLRALYTYRDEVLPRWDPDAGLARGEEQGGPEFAIGLIGAGQIGTCVLDSVLRSAHVPARNVYVSTRRPETLVHYERTGVNVCFDNAKVAAKADVLFLACQPNNIAQIASVIRGLVRHETLVVSLMAGQTSERVAQLLQVPCVFKTQLGKESGLPVADEREVSEAITRVTSGAEGGSVDEIKKRAHRLEESRHKEALGLANIAASMRALVGDADDLAKLIVSLSKLLMVLVSSEVSARDVAQGAICNFMREQRIWGHHVMMDELPVGARVRMAATSSDMPERGGVIKEKLRNREEYVVVAVGKEVRCRRNRMVEEGAVSIEEGFALEEYRQLKSSLQYAKFQEHFRKIGELCNHGTMPTAGSDALVFDAEKSIGFSSDKGMGSTLKSVRR